MKLVVVLASSTDINHVHDDHDVGESQWSICNTIQEHSISQLPNNVLISTQSALSSSVNDYIKIRVNMDHLGYRYKASQVEQLCKFWESAILLNYRIDKPIWH